MTELEQKAMQTEIETLKLKVTLLTHMVEELQPLKGVTIVLDALTDFRTDMARRFERVDARLEKMDGRFDSMDAKLDQLLKHWGIGEAPTS